MLPLAVGRNSDFSYLSPVYAAEMIAAMPQGHLR
jgi:hypothetical protein